MRALPSELGVPLEVELVGEKASALGKAAERLEKALADLAGLDRELAAAPEQREARAAERRVLREIASERLWFVLVQREAMGLRQHEPLFRVYDVPPEVRRLVGPRRPR